MLNWLDSNISVETLIWLFPITFLIHDFEEIIFVEAWFKKYYERILPRVPNEIKKHFKNWPVQQPLDFHPGIFTVYCVCFCFFHCG